MCYMSGFVKIYGTQLLDSTLWMEDWQARLVFVSMLALADQKGFVNIPSVRVLASRLNLPQVEVERGLEVLLAPDKESRSPEEEGRRVLALETGWHVVNYEKYREFRTERQEAARLRVAKWRDDRVRTSNAGTHGDTRVHAEAEAELKAEPVSANPTGPPHPTERETRPEGPKADRVKVVWDYYIDARGKALQSLLKPRSRVGLSDTTRGRVRKLLKHVRESQGLAPDEAAGQVCEFIDAMCALAVAEGDPGRFRAACPLFAITWWDPWIAKRDGLDGTAPAAPTHMDRRPKVWATS